MIYSNPMYTNVETTSIYANENTATYQGITLKTLLLLGIAGISGILSGLFMNYTQNPVYYSVTLLVALFVGFITVIIGRSDPKKAMVCSIIYSISEGLVIGMITLVADYFYQGIALIAVASTAVIFVVCLALFASGAMRNVSKLKSMFILILCSIVAVSIVLILLTVFNIDNTAAVIKSYYKMVIFLEFLYILYGFVMLFFNFNEATLYVQEGAIKSFEWVAAFGLVLSILYIYLEILRLLIYIMQYARND